MRHFDIKNNVLIEQIDIKSTIREFERFLLFCKQELDLDRLPDIDWSTNHDVGSGQPSFGAFHNNDQSIKLSIINRHPLDIMRTLAHELCHYKQYTQGKLNQRSGETGSSEENEANSVAGIIMRKWGKSNPNMFAQKPIIREAAIKLRGFGTDNEKSAAVKWIQKIRAQHPKNPLNPNQIVIVYSDDQVATVELAPCIKIKNAVHIKWIQASPSRQGVGSKAMKMLQDLAKKDDIQLTLYPMETGPVAKQDLIRFYSKMGFKTVSDNGLMMWSPGKQ
jgi:hypothetical protein